MTAFSLQVTSILCLQNYWEMVDLEAVAATGQDWEPTHTCYVNWTSEALEEISWFPAQLQRMLLRIAGFNQDRWCEPRISVRSNPECWLSGCLGNPVCSLLRHGLPLVECK